MPRKKITGLFKEIQQQIVTEEKIKETASTLEKFAEIDAAVFDSMNLNPRQKEAVLVAKFGMQYVQKVIKRNDRIPRCWPQAIRVHLMEGIIEGGENLKDVEYIVGTLTSECEQEQKTSDLDFIGPPVGYCIACGKPLQTHNKPVHVKYVHHTGEITYKSKVTLRCPLCKVNYRFDKFGSSKEGYRFYDSARDSICATDGILVDRIVYNIQWSFAQHCWVSFMGFAEAWRDAHKINSNDVIDRRVWADCFWWGEVEAELRDTGYVDHPFLKVEDRENCMIAIDQLRRGSLYPHPADECTDACRARGCGKLWVTDGLWKLQFAHCMFHVENQLEDHPLINLPKVCTNPPAPGKAFCPFHCQQCEKHKPPIPTRLQDLQLGDLSPAVDPETAGVNKTVYLDHMYARPYIEDFSGQDFLQNNAEAVHAIDQNSGEVPSNCRKDIGVRKTLRTMSRGHQFVVRAGGHIDTWTPLYQSESPGQVLLFIISWLYNVVQHLPVNEWGKIWLAYDNMCQLLKMKASNVKLPLPHPYSEMWMTINKVIDSLHIANHVDKNCQKNLHPSKIGLMHPEIKDSKNTQAAEQTFIWAGRFKKIVCSMDKIHHMFYLHRMVKRRNAYTAWCYRNGRKPVLPGIRNAKSS